MRNRFWFGMMISVSTYFCSSSIAGFGDAHAVDALELERLGDDADRQDARFAGGAGDDRSRAGAGAAAHPGGDEHHVRALHRFEDVVDRLLGGGASDIGPRAGAEPAGHADAELDLARRRRQLQRLRVGVADDELAADQVRPDHVVDRVAAGAADPDDGDARLQLLLVLRDAEIDHDFALHACAAVMIRPVRVPRPSRLAPIAA